MPVRSVADRSNVSPSPWWAAKPPAPLGLESNYCSVRLSSTGAHGAFVSSPVPVRDVANTSTQRHGRGEQIHLELVSDAVTSKYTRVLLKLSGEAFAGDRGFGIDGDVVGAIADDIANCREELGVEIAVVVGAGNIWRGMTGAERGIDRAQADYMGMLATVMNALALQDILEQKGVPTRVQSAISMPQVAETYIRRKAIRHMEKNRVVIFAAGTGNPFFTTDTTAALRAVEIDAQVLLKGTHGGIDGIYTADPKTNPDATKIDTLTYLDVLNRNLRVMDATAIAHCNENQMPIVVFDLMGEGNLRSLLLGESVGTLVS